MEEECQCYLPLKNDAMILNVALNEICSVPTLHIIYYQDMHAYIHTYIHVTLHLDINPILQTIVKL